MKYKQTWIVPGGTAHGTAGLEPVHNTFAPPMSYAYFCPTRGDVWARRICTDEAGNTTRWHCYTVLHPDEPNPYKEFWPSGTLLSFIDERTWHLIPPAILAREFLILYEWAMEGLTTS